MESTVKSVGEFREMRIFSNLAESWTPKWSQKLITTARSNEITQNLFKGPNTIANMLVSEQ